jgi:tRNA (guanine-N7-)-methyltransferase
LSKNKLRKFAEMETFDRVFQPEFEAVFNRDFHLKGQWAASVFNNDHPVVLELGCGKGEYTLGLAQRYPGKNFIGVDIKGARIWKGAKTANEGGLKNAAFLRTRIEFIESFFGPSEVDEIWITFPDPQLKKRRNKKRLTGPRFLNQYRTFLKDGGVVHLKTDNDVLFRYTAQLARHNGLEIIAETSDLYHQEKPGMQGEISEALVSIQTTYEKLFLSEGSNINYIAFRLPCHNVITDLPEQEAYEA